MSFQKQGAVYSSHARNKRQGIPILFSFEVYFFYLSFSKNYDLILWFLWEEQPLDCLFTTDSLDTTWDYKIPKVTKLHIIHIEEISITVEKS